MTTHYYASDCAEGIASMIELFRSTPFDGEDVKVSVMNGDVVMRCIDFEEMQERNLAGYMGNEVCSLSYDGTRLTVGFHENQVAGTFELTPAGTDGPVDPQQATSLKELAPAVGSVMEVLEDYVDVVTYDFMAVSSASIATSGHFCDFEFEYAVTTTDL